MPAAVPTAAAAPARDAAGDAASASLWRDRGFVLLWAGQTVSVLGSQFSTVALPLTAVLLLQMTALQMGLLQAARTLPALALLLFAGVWVDRVRRRPILIAADVGRAALLGLIPALHLAGLLRAEYLLAIALGAGALTVLFDTAYGAYVPSVVARSRLTDANGKLVSSSQAAGVVGPNLAGAAVTLLSAPVAVVVDALSFVLSAVLLWRIRTSEPPPARGARRPLWTEAAEGMRFVVGDRFLRTVIAAMAFNNLAGSMYGAVYVLYVVDELGLPPTVLGFLLGAVGVGALGGSLVAHGLVRRLGLGRVMLLAGGLATLGFAAVPLAGAYADAAVPLLLTGQLLQPFGFGCAIVAIQSLAQAVTPNGLQGRVGATRRLVTLGVMPLGAVVAGVIGSSLGLDAVLALVVVAALAQTVTCLPLAGIDDGSRAAAEAAHR
jgi:MFS family permease